MWKICTREGHPTILIPVDDTIPEGYVNEGLTSNPSYLELIVNNLGRKITPLAFLNRFTTAEQVSTELASVDNPAAPLQTRQMAATLRVYLRNINVAAYIDLDREDTQAGVIGLESVGILAAGRANEILSAPVTAGEVPTVRRE